MPSRPKPRTSPLRSLLRHPLVKWTLLGATGLGVAGLATLAVFWSIYSRDAEGFLTLFQLRPPKTITKVFDRNGDVIGVFAEEHRVMIPYGDIPKAFVGALVATEDADFWTHKGVSYRGVARAIFTAVRTFGRRREGFSTLTMQLVRNVTAKRQKRLDRKLKEVILARKLEGAFSKKQILEAYANEVNFGGGRYGIESASQYYFAKSAPQLNVEECALLAGLVQRPGRFNPFSTDPKVREAVQARRNHVLRRMVDEKYLKEADAKILMERPYRLARENADQEAVAPYAVEEVRKYLYEKYGKDAVLTGGLEVHTTLDSVWQQAANEAVRKGLRAVDRRRGFRKEAVVFVDDPDKAQFPGWARYFEPNDLVRGVILAWEASAARVRIGPHVLTVPDSAFAWAGKGVRTVLVRGAAPLFLVKEAPNGAPTKLELDQEPEVEGALLAVDPKTGEIRALVGGYDYKRSRFNRAWQAERQVGSTMKAFVYGAAFEAGYTPASIVNDVPTRFLDETQFRIETSADGRFIDARPLYPSSKIYEPGNYERNFFGPIPVWEAIRDSRNVPAVRTLDEVGIPKVIDFARRCGVDGTIPPYPSMALGAADLPLRDMVRGYATLCNGGLKAPPPFLIKRIVDRSGRELERYEGTLGEQVVDPGVVFELVQCLQGVATRGTGARCGELAWPVAGKTGTTDEHTDAWYLGFSTRITCGVWVGLDAKKTIYKGADGAKVAVPIWVDFMKTALRTTPKEEFEMPEGMEWADMDRITGLRATGATEAKDRIHLAFRQGRSPKGETDAEALQRFREAAVRASGLAPETRILGKAGARAESAPDGSREKDPNL